MPLGQAARAAVSGADVDDEAAIDDAPTGGIN